MLTARWSIPDLLTVVQLRRGKCIPFRFPGWQPKCLCLHFDFFIQQVLTPSVWQVSSRFHVYKSVCGTISPLGKDFPVPGAHFLQPSIFLCAPFSESKAQASDGGAGPVQRFVLIQSGISSLPGFHHCCYCLVSWFCFVCFFFCFQKESSNNSEIYGASQE